MGIIYFLLLLIITTLPQHGNGQTPNNPAPQYLAFGKYTALHGLSNSHVNAIGQDSKGFLWVGTNDGLNRFDGLTFQTFHYSDTDSSSINSNTVFCIFTDRDQNIWFGTFSGICSYDYQSEKFVRHPLSQQSCNTKYQPVRAIAQTHDGDLWLATSGGGLARLSPASGSVKYYKHSDNTPSSICSNYLQAIAIDNKGHVWVGSENNGISILDPATGNCTHISKQTGQIRSNMITTLFSDSDGRIWIGTYEGGITIHTPQDGLYSSPSISDKPISVYGIAERVKNDFWIATQEEGLYHFDGSRFDHFSKALGNTQDLINDNIHAIYTDTDQNLWVGAFQGGVNKLKARPIFSGYDGDNLTAIQHKTILGIYPDTKESIYICTDGDGLIIWNSITQKYQHIKAGANGLKTNTIRCAYKDHENRIWIGTYLKGLQEYHPETGKFSGWENIPGDSLSLANNDVTCIVEDRLGNLWIGTNGGLNLMDKQTGKFQLYRNDPSLGSKSIISDHITNLYVDGYGHLWISTYWGVSRMDPAKGEVRNYPTDNNDNTYYCVYQDSRQRIWAGTTTGLRLMDPNDGSYTTFSTANGLPSNVIDGIVEDKDGNLWLSTNQGICKFNYEKNLFRNFYTEDGLIANEFIHNSFASDTDGEIMFGSIDGITRFYPDRIACNNKPPRVVITDLLVFNKKITPSADPETLPRSTMETDEIKLNWADNSFTLIYKAIEYNQPQRIRYASRMVGFDPGWNYYNHTQNSASYTNLNPGVYHFEVKASNDGEIWSKPVTIKIRIIAPLWRRWWAIASYVISGMAILVLAFAQYRRSHQEKRLNEIKYLKQQSDIKLNRSRLQFFTNISHEFRTPLTLIMSPLEQMMGDHRYDPDTQGQFSLMHRNAEKLLRMVNQIMDIRKIDNTKVQMNPAKGDLVKFVREVYENFNQLASSHGITFRFKSEIAEFQAYYDSELIDKALYNLLSNAFKFTPENGRIDLSIRRADRKSENNVVIIVEDNGRGISEENIDKIFDRFFQGDTSAMQPGTGIGLWLTKEFIEMHHGIISVSSQVGQGTAFTIMLTDGEEFKDIAKDKAEYNHMNLGSVIEEAVDETLPSHTPSYTDTTPAQQEGDRPTLLIVDDTREINDYLATNLKKIYDVRTAYDGIEGLRIAKETMPDLVITDIMMPGIDGIELCRTLKTDIDTCHIPVIMLTAKSSEEQRIEGLATGADSYIPKPFNPKHLLVRIQKLLELRKTLRDKFGNDISFDAEQAGITVPDRDLLKKVTSVIKKRISDSKLTVETLAEEVGISRGHLQRKLKSLTGQNPNEFIRIIRLKQAAEILIENDVTIAEVADMVGFSSQSYFSTAFTKQFNISPSQYVESHRGNN